ncbi:putative trafficking protein particle complex subunit 13-like protein [Diplonema papillatum]|nr:putative trafficking protein particle complex subunit 13-like protein [Diplonema papillatum]
MAAPPALAHATPGMPVVKTDHAISLKVMRLLRPELRLEDEMYLEPDDPCYDFLNRDNDVVQTELRLPPSMGQVHDGETFVVCVSLHNVSVVDVKDVAVKVELLTATKRVGLLDVDRNTIASFPPHGHKDFIMEYPLQDEGGHTLMCNVMYSDDKEQRTFRKVFKFLVGRTVRIKEVKIWTIDDHVNIYVELQNMTKNALLVYLNFSPSAAYQLIEVPNVKGDVWQKAMGPNEVCRYLFQLLPKTGRELVQSVSIGRLEITWFGKMGERGRLESTDIQHRGSEKAAVEVTQVDVPDVVAVHEPFTLKATLTNTSPDHRSMNLCVVLLAEKLHPLVFSGPSPVFLGTLAYQESKSVELRLMALTSGVQEIQGIEVRDATSRRILLPTLTSVHVQVTS